MQHKLPIGYLDAEDWKEGGSSSAAGGTLGIPTRAPHPHAAKVFINWLLSREGQSALQKLGRPDAHNSRLFADGTRCFRCQRFTSRWF